MRVGPTELLVILAIILLLFGPKKLPELARGMGEAVKEFKKGQADIDKTINEPLINEDHKADTKTVPTVENAERINQEKENK